jgi:hypothetical protein
MCAFVSPPTHRAEDLGRALPTNKPPALNGWGANTVKRSATIEKIEC